MERNFPAAGFPDFGVGAGWTYDRAAGASLMYGSSRSPSPDSEMLHGQTYGTPRPLRGCATNPQPGVSRHGATWGPAGRTLGLAGLFDTSFHHVGPSDPDPSVRNLISSLESRAPPTPPSASSLFPQFHIPAWQTAMDTPASAELFVPGTLPSSASFPSSSGLPAHQHPGSFSGRSFTSSLSVQDTPTFSPTSTGLLISHDPLLHIKAPFHSSLGFDQLLSSQTSSFRSSQEATVRHQRQPSASSNCLLPSPQLNQLSSQLHNQSSQLHNQSSQLYNPSVFPSTLALPHAAPPQAPPPKATAVSRQDSVIKHCQSSSTPQATTIAQQQYVSSGGSSDYQQIASHHQHAGVSCSPLEEQRPSSDPNPSPLMESQTYGPVTQTPYTSSSSTSSACSSSDFKVVKSSSSINCSVSLGSASVSSHNPKTPLSASSTSSSASSVSKASTISLAPPPCQQVPPQSAHHPSVVSSSPVQQATPKQCLSTYGSPPVAAVKSNNGLSDKNPSQPQTQPYSPSQISSAHKVQSYESFNSPHPEDLSAGVGNTGGKTLTNLSSRGRSFSEAVFADSSFVSLANPVRKISSPSLVCGSTRSLTESGGGAGAVAAGIEGSSAGSGSEDATVGNGGTSFYHLPECSHLPSISSATSHYGLHSPPAQSPGGSGTGKHMSSILSPACISSPQVFSDTQTRQRPSYHTSPPKPKSETGVLGVDRSQDEQKNDDVIIQRLMDARSLSCHHSQYHPLPQQPLQLVSHARDGEVKAGAYIMTKNSEEPYHLQSVIRINNATGGTASGTAGGAGCMNSQLEISLTKQQQDNPELSMSTSTVGGVAGGTNSLCHSSTTNPHQEQHDSLSFVLHCESDYPYMQHHTSLVSSHCQTLSQLSRHMLQADQSHSPKTGYAHSHSHHRSHMELKSPTGAMDLACLRDTSDMQHQAYGLMDSSSDSPQQNNTLRSVLSHSTHSRMDSQQQSHPLSVQHRMVSATGAVPRRAELNPENHSSSLQLQCQSHADDTQYILRTQTKEQTQGSQNLLSCLDMLDRPLPQTNRRESEVAPDTSSGSFSQERGEGERHRKGRPQQMSSDIQNLFFESDIGLSIPSHLHHLNLPQAYPRVHHQQKGHAYHQLSHSQSTQVQSHCLATNTHGPQQQHLQPKTSKSQLPQSQLDHVSQHQFSPVSPVDEVRQSQCKQQHHHHLQQQQQGHNQQRFGPPSPACFPESSLDDDDLIFFPGVEDMFCSMDYKSSFAGDVGEAHAVQEGISQVGGQEQEGAETLKTGGAAGSCERVGQRSGQGYGQNFHSAAVTENGSLHLHLNTLKTHELPCTVSTDQLGLVQSQTLTVGGQRDGAVAKTMGPDRAGVSSSSTGLTSPIFCLSRPKKLLKTSSFHLLKQRREPQPQTKKNYAQEYEFEDDEDKADVPADIRLNSRRLPDLLPDLVSSCRKAEGTSGVSRLSPLRGDTDVCHPSSYSSFGHAPQLLTHDGPKRRGRKPTRPKREGPPRPRGRPRIRPLPEPPYCRRMMGSMSGESRRGRGRGRGRGRREEGLIETQQNMNKSRLPYPPHQRQQFNQQHLQQHVQQPHQQQQQHHHHHQQQQHHHQQHHLHQQQQLVSCLHHQQQHEQHKPQEHQLPSFQRLQQEPLRPVKIKPSVPDTLPSESTYSLSSAELVLSDGSLGSAPILGLSPGPSTVLDITKRS